MRLNELSKKEVLLGVLLTGENELRKIQKKFPKDKFKLGKIKGIPDVVHRQFIASWFGEKQAYFTPVDANGKMVDLDKPVMNDKEKVLDALANWSEQSAKPLLSEIKKLQNGKETYLATIAKESQALYKGKTQVTLYRADIDTGKAKVGTKGGIAKSYSLTAKGAKYYARSAGAEFDVKSVKYISENIPVANIVADFRQKDFRKIGDLQEEEVIVSQKPLRL